LAFAKERRFALQFYNRRIMVCCNIPTKSGLGG